MIAEVSIAVVWHEGRQDYTPIGFRYWYNTAPWWELLAHRQEVRNKYDDIGGIIRLRIDYSPTGEHTVKVLSLRSVADMVRDLDHAIGVIIDAITADLTTLASNQE